MEEDSGVFAADCVVLSCCCQGLVFQVTAIVFFKIPCKLAQKMKKRVKRRWGRTLQPAMEDVKEEHSSGNGFDFGEASLRLNCIENIEGMLQELPMNKEFLFGGFWRHEDSSDIFDFK